MVAVHATIGLAVVVAFLLSTILNFLRMTRGSTFSWARGVSFAAAGLLLVQYLLGFSLLGGDGDITPIHYILALAVIVPVGAEHMMATQQETPRGQARVAFFANLVVTVMVLIVYAIGETNT
jgi:hypothetical protein